MFRAFSVQHLCALILLAPVVAFSAPLKENNSENFFGGDYVEEIEHINVGRKANIAGNLVCQDGRHLYFKSIEACEAANHNELLSGRFECTQDLQVVPLEEIEEIYTSFSRSMLTFFSVQRTYEVSQYKRVSDNLPAQYILVGRYNKKIEDCENRPTLSGDTIFSSREASLAQEYLIHELLRNHIILIRKPYGQFMLFESEQSIQPFSRFISKFSAKYSQFVSQESTSLKLSSPSCNPSVNSHTLIELLGGESSGGGYSNAKTKELSSLSTELRVHRRLSDSQWTELMKKPFDSTVRAFDVTCAPVQ